MPENGRHPRSPGDEVVQVQQKQSGGTFYTFGEDEIAKRLQYCAKTHCCSTKTAELTKPRSQGVLVVVLSLQLPSTIDVPDVFKIGLTPASYSSLLSGLADDSRVKAYIFPMAAHYVMKKTKTDLNLL